MRHSRQSKGLYRILGFGQICSETVRNSYAPDTVEAHHLRLGSQTSGQDAGTALETLQKILVEGLIDPDGIPFEDLIREIERGLILRAAEASGWNQSRTADMLHVKRDKLRYRMKIHDLHEMATVPHE